MEMKWRKLGKIFDPKDHNLVFECKEFAQSPQSLVFDNFIRIYFSTRVSDAEGMFLSHIAYVDLDKSFKKVLRTSEKPVIDLGGVGCYDEHGIFPLNILKGECESEVLGYITGWNRRQSVAVDGSIGLAISKDSGETFERIGPGPVLTSSIDEPFMVADGFVARYLGKYHMWYIFGTKWLLDEGSKRPERVYKIAHAISDDGVVWQKNDGEKIISDVLGEDECQALPTVVEYNGRYHMYFCFRQARGFREVKESAYRLGYAHSDDLKSWTRDDASAGIDVSADGWDSEMMCYPHVFKCDDKVYMLYNGNNFGRFGFGIAVLED